MEAPTGNRRKSLTHLRVPNPDLQPSRPSLLPAGAPDERKNNDNGYHLLNTDYVPSKL